MPTIHEDEIARLRHELDQARRQAAEATGELDLMMYSISHDLRAPLRAISGFSQILVEDYAERLDDQARRYLGVIQDSGRRMDMHIQAILALSRIGRREMQVTDLDMNAIASAAIAACRINNPDCTIGIVVAELPAAAGDRQMVREILDELLANAVKAVRGRPEAEIRVTGERAGGGETVYSVSDNGMGFDMEYADKLFGVFQKLHTPDQFPGDGAGLARVRRLVARHGGRAWAKAEPERGATFSFSLPVKVRMANEP